MPLSPIRTCAFTKPEHIESLHTEFSKDVQDVISYYQFDKILTVVNEPLINIAHNFKISLYGSIGLYPYQKLLELSKHVYEEITNTHTELQKLIPTFLSVFLFHKNALTFREAKEEDNCLLAMRKTNEAAVQILNLYNDLENKIQTLIQDVSVVAFEIPKVVKSLESSLTNEPSEKERNLFEVQCSGLKSTTEALHRIIPILHTLSQILKKTSHTFQDLKNSELTHPNLVQFFLSTDSDTNQENGPKLIAVTMYHDENGTPVKTDGVVLKTQMSLYDLYKKSLIRWLSLRYVHITFTKKIEDNLTLDSSKIELEKCINTYLKSSS